jgi:hypothetical protein
MIAVKNNGYAGWLVVECGNGEKLKMRFAARETRLLIIRKIYMARTTLKDITLFFSKNHEYIEAEVIGTEKQKNRLTVNVVTIKL